MTKNNQFSHFVTVFHGRYSPETDIQLAGYAALIATYNLETPLPHLIAAISHKHRRYIKDEWALFTPRHKPEDSLAGHLSFALKYEGVDLGVLKVLFDIINKNEIIKIVMSNPAGSYSRRIWFLYEWLQQTKLKIEDSTTGKYVHVIDTKLQYGGPDHKSKRHRVYNNMPGVPDFCPLIRKTKLLEEYQAIHLAEKAKRQLGKVHPDVLSRAAAFLLLKDSKASYAIEGETPPQSRAERWGNAIGQAGLHPLSDDEFLRLQQIVIADFRFTHLGYRNQGGFIGEHERGTGYPIPDHISARWQDLPTLMDGLIKTESLLEATEFDPVLTAAMISFGFVFIHPFEDGNGRIHRYLIHHVLAAKHFVDNGFIFPVSAVMQNKLNEYRKILENFSKPRLPLIKWKATDTGNVEVINDTLNLYRYFDATIQAEFLYECIKITIDTLLPDEINYLKNYDEMKSYITNHFEIPERLIDLLIMFLAQNNGKLSKRARSKEFQALTKQEIEGLENRFTEIFYLPP